MDMMEEEVAEFCELGTCLVLLVRQIVEFEIFVLEVLPGSGKEPQEDGAGAKG